MNLSASDRAASRNDSGFTLTELMVVLIIIPLIIGAIAGVIGVVYGSSGSTKSRLSDSVNAQFTAAYFPRDVEAAEFITTSSTAATVLTEAISTTNVYSGVSEPVTVCGASTAGNVQLLVGLFRPAVLANASTGTPAANGDSVAYWLHSYTGAGGTTAYEVVRDTCTVSISGTQAVPVWTVSSTPKLPVEVITDDVNYLTQQIAAISSSTFATLAASNWTPTASVTELTSSAPLQTGSANAIASLPVVSTSGFSTGSPVTIYVATQGGTQSVTCTGATTATQFSNCYISTGGSSASAPAGALVSQPNAVADVKLSVGQPSSNFNYSLEGVPQAFNGAEYGSSGGGGGGGPPLLFLGGSSGFPAFIDGSNNQSDIKGSASVNVNGAIALNGDSVSCQKASGLYDDGNDNVTGGGTVSGCTNAANSTEVDGSAVLDPIGPNLPLQGAWNASTGFKTALTSNPAKVGGVCQPGEYTTASTFNACSQLAPGVYEVDSGTVSGSTLSYSGATGSGVLLYMNCTNSACSSGPTFNDSIANLPGLSAAQSVAYFGTTALANLLYWQNATDTNNITIWGSQSSTTQSGIIYAPSAQITAGGNACLEAAQIIVKQIAITGGGSPSACGSYDINVLG